MRPAMATGNDLWEPILQLGIAVVEGTPPAAIVAPWHPLRLCGTAVKIRQACGLVNYLLYGGNGGLRRCEALLQRSERRTNTSLLSGGLSGSARDAAGPFGA